MTKPQSHSLRLRAPAKINLGLKILGRRADGYHQLESVFVPISLADELELEIAPAAQTQIALTVRCTQSSVESGVPSDARNLAFRAARKFLETAGLSAEVRLRLVKKIPAAAGLGGGSSDAAAVLRGLASIFPQALSSVQIQEMALGLGADLPFFLDPQPALVTGIGEQIAPFDFTAPLALLLANPGVPLATVEVYRAYDAAANSLTMSEAGSTMRAVLGLQESSWFRARNLPNWQSATAQKPKHESPSTEDEWSRSRHEVAKLFASLLRNDLEPAASALCPAIVELREQIAAVGATAVGLSGSGPTVYGIFEDLEAARAAQRELQKDATCRARWPRLWLEVAETGTTGSQHLE